MPFTVTIRRTFCASHRLRIAGDLEPMHGHTWRVAVEVRRDDGGLDASDCVVDFHDLHARLDAVVDPWHNNDLNTRRPFVDGVNPSAERVAEAVGRLLELPDGLAVVRVDVTEAEQCVATWRP